MLRTRGCGEVLSDDASIGRYRSDRSGHVGDATGFVVVVPSSVDEVQAACRVAHAEGVALVPRGTGTGLAGGAAARSGCIVLSLERLDRILDIDPIAQTCRVEAGVITADVSAAVAPHGLRYAPDPASVAISTIGGNIATNAGGLCCVKYGVTRESVLALDVVLADGTLIHTGHRSIKGVSGYDLTALLTGSEGTLGVVVSATLRLLPVSLARPVTLCAFFPTTVEAVRASTAVFGTGVRPSMLELVDEVHLARIDAWRGSDLRSAGAAVLIAQCDGLAASTEAELVAAEWRRHGVAVEVTADPQRESEILDIRRWTSQDSPVRPELTLNEDIAVPRGSLAPMIEAIEAIRARFAVTITILAHIGDGNLHANLRVPLEELEEGRFPARVWDAADAMVETALALGGTISGEHGIGLLKRRWLERELGTPQYEVQRAVKAAFDPTGILNPGAMFER